MIFSAKVLELRGRQQRDFPVTLLLSQGVAMLVAGDERGRSLQPRAGRHSDAARQAAGG